MSAAELKAKRALCSISDTSTKIEELESEWLSSLLLRLKISKEMLDKRAKDGVSNTAWRDHLLRNFGVSINKDLSTKTVSVWKYNEKDESTVKVGEWSKPEVVRILKEGKTVCELVLKFWQLL